MALNAEEKSKGERCNGQSCSEIKTSINIKWKYEYEMESSPAEMRLIWDLNHKVKQNKQINTGNFELYKGKGHE